jgi:RNA polymerase sigma-70 factor, ECF subfamily
MSSSNDVEKIVKLCQKGDKNAFSQLVDGYSSRLYGYFYRLTGNRDDSNELLSELFLKVVEKISACRAETFEAWLFKMASNLFADFIRTKKRHEKMLNYTAKEFEAEMLSSPKNDYLTDKLTQQLQRLDSETAEIIVMRYYSGLSFEELAKIRKEPLGTCLSKVHRGLKKLKELMENSDD